MEQDTSKSQRKRESTALQRVGAELIELSKGQLDRLDLPVAVFEAVMSAQAIRQRGALKRHVKYIGKLLRGLDSTPICEALDRLRNESGQVARLHHEAERWRDRLLAEGEKGVSPFVASYPEADPQKLEQLIGNAHKESAHGGPRRSARALYRYLRAYIEASSSP